MRNRIHLIVAIFGLTALMGSDMAWGIGLKRSGGGGGGGGRSFSKSMPSRSAPKPSYRPSAKPKPISKPQPKPAQRPSTGSRPSFGGGGGGSRLPSRPSLSKPETRPSLPSKPSTRPSIPQRPDIGFRPPQRPSIPEKRPSLPEKRPSLPENRPSLPEKRPSLPEGKPSLPFTPSNPPKLPNRPGGGGERPNLPNLPGGGERPNLPDRPGAGERPSLPNLPGGGDRPSLPSRPGERPGNLPEFGGGSNRPSIPDPPGRPARPPRPEWGDRWQNNDNFFNSVGNRWNSDNINVVNNFNVDRSREWNSINTRWNQNGWHSNWGTASYNSWRRDVWGFRGNRCREVWYRTGPFGYHNHFFNVHWYGSCWWRPRPYTYRHCSPWWWWRPVAWGTVGFFFGQALAPDPVVYNPGTTVIYEGDTVYINGESAGDATTYRQETIQLANPPVTEIPIPEPPPAPAEMAEGAVVDEDPEEPQGDWLPVGVWALTQQEQGDATMFFQLSVDKQGIVGGAYKNVMTGDEQPVVGQLDFESQRVAWHIGENTTTVYETGLSNFENDVAGVFVHFGETQTQNWLLVRMPSPEMPPGTVKLPEVED